MNEYICIYDEDEMAYIPNPYEEKTELVRCKKCEYYDDKHCVCCVYLSYRLAKNEDDFCSDAKRKEE